MQSKTSLLLRVYFRLCCGLLLLVSFCIVGASASQSAHAAAEQTLTVTDCSGESGSGQIGSVLASASAGDTINFSCSGTIPITSTLVIGTNNLTLDGSGQSVTLDGGSSTQVLSVQSGITFTLNALTIAHGVSSFGGGLSNSGTMTISNSTFSGNTSTNEGGGVGNYGTMTINNSTFSGNSVTYDGGGLANTGTMTVNGSTFTSNTSGFYAGALYSNNTITITNSTFTSNSSEYAGGLFNDGNSTTSTMTISGSTFTNNSNYNGSRDGGLGGAILTESADFTISAILTVSDSTFTGNSSVLFGGGIDSFGGTETISNSTFTNNSASYSGGAITAEDASNMSINNSTIAYNKADTDYYYYGGGISDLMSTVSVEGSIVAENTAVNSSSNCYNSGGTSIDNGYNLTNDISCRFTGTGSLRNTNPRFDPNGLQNNGGPTQTLALEPDSPAVDYIPVGSSCPATDQRGVSRPQGPACDIGAIEMTNADGLTVMINVVNSFHLSQNIQTTLDNQLQAALTAVNHGQTKQTCADLTNFLTDVRLDTGNGISSSQATELRRDATVIENRLGC